MSLQFSFIKCEENTLNTINIKSPDPEIGLYTNNIKDTLTPDNIKDTLTPVFGLYTNNIKDTLTPKHITPISTEYMKHFYAKTHNPSYTRLGNNTEPDNLC